MTRSSNIRLSRRAMLKRTAAVAGSMVAPLVVPGSVLGMNGATAPSNRITVGSIGVGMMGRGHFRIFTEYPDVQLLALSDVDPWRRNDSTRVLEEAYGARQAEWRVARLPGLQRFSRTARSRRHRCGDRGHRRALASGHQRAGGQGRQGHLLRKAHLPDDSASAHDGRDRAAAQSRVPDRIAAAQLARIPQSDGDGARRSDR